MEELPGEDSQAQNAIDVVWAIFNLLLGIWLFTCINGQHPPGIDPFSGRLSVVWILVIARVTEFVAFILRPAAVVMGGQATTAGAFLAMLFWVVQLSVHAPALWAFAHYVRRYDKEKTVWTAVREVLPFTTWIAALVIVAWWNEDANLYEVLFVAGFEPPIVFGSLYALGMFLASLRQNCRHDGIRQNALALFAVSVLAYIAHLVHINLLPIPFTGMFYREFSTELKVMQQLFEGAALATAHWLTLTLAEMGAFLNCTHPEGSPWAPTQGGCEPYAVRVVVSPERLWTFSFLFYFLAFFLSGSCLFHYKGLEWIRHDAIVAFYGTIHPCVLLDYTPGTIFAQPLFDLQILIVILSMWASFVRHLLQGSMSAIMVSATGMILALVVGACFNLVFTFNPRTVSVLAHSVPYMCNVALQFLFIGTEALAIFVFKYKPHEVPGFFFYVVFVLSVAFFINFFMAARLMSKLDFATRNMEENIAAGSAPNNEQPILQLFRAALTVLALDGFFMAWFQVNPNRKEAVAFNVVAMNCEPDGDGADSYEQVPVFSRGAEQLVQEAEVAQAAATQARFQLQQQHLQLQQQQLQIQQQQLQLEQAMVSFHQGPPTPTKSLGTASTMTSSWELSPSSRSLKVAQPHGSRSLDMMAKSSPKAPVVNPYSSANGLLKLFVPVELPLLLATVCTFIGVALCIVVNKKYHNNKEMTFGEDLNTYPGSSFLVVFWIFAVVGFFIHAVYDVFYEACTNCSPPLLWARRVSAVFLVFAALMAHTTTIPSSQEWLHEYFAGTTLFATALILWFGVGILLLLQDYDNLRPTNFVADVAAHVVCILMLFLCATIGTKTIFYATGGAILIKCFCNAKGARVVLSDAEIVANINADNCIPWPPIWIAARESVTGMNHDIVPGPVSGL